MDKLYDEIAYIGYTLLIIVFSYNAYTKKEINSSWLMLLGTFIFISGMTFTIIEKYNLDNNKNDEDDDECYHANKFKPKMGNLLLSIYTFTSFILPINLSVKFTDIYNLMGNTLLINKYDNNQMIAYGLLAIHYSMMSSKILDNSAITRLQGVAGICLLLYATKQTLKYYNQYIDKIKDKKI